MAYAYGTKGAPAVGLGAPGLPRTAEVRGELLFPLPGLYRVQVPEGVTTMCAAVTAAAGGVASSGIFGGGVTTIYTATGGAGATAWLNDIPVTPGDWIDVFVGRAPGDVYNGSGIGTAADGGNSWVISPTVCCAGGGKGGNGTTGGAGGLVLAGNGGAGGDGAVINYQSGATDQWFVSGAGAGGYLGKGGNAVKSSSDGSVAGNPGAGGGGGSGAAGYPGGGVAPFGIGTDGAGGLVGVGTSAQCGKGGSGGEDGTYDVAAFIAGLILPGRFGAGPIHRKNPSQGVTYRGADGVGRIIWGPGRAFPSTDVGMG